MYRFEQRQKYKRLTRSKIPLLLAILLLAVISKASFNLYKKERYSERILEALKMERDNLLLRTKNLSEDMEVLDTDRGKEAALREKFDVAKEGEGVITLVSPEETAATFEKEGWSLWNYIKSLFGAK